MQLILLNGFYLGTNVRCGPWSVAGGTVTSSQINNANIVRSFFLNEGWTINAIAGLLGNMMAESTINPAIIQATNRWRLPHHADTLADVPNSVMQNFFMEYYGDLKKAYAIGMCQWDGYSVHNNVKRQKLVAFAEDNNIIWYDGWTQLYRIVGEHDYDINNNKTSFFRPVRYGGVTYTFTNYPTSTASPETLAAAWAAGYERNAGGTGYRDRNARWWYDYFTTDPTAPSIIPPQDFLLPLPEDPDLPPFDPDDPVPPDESQPDKWPGWYYFILAPRNRKELRSPCRRM